MFSISKRTAEGFGRPSEISKGRSEAHKHKRRSSCLYLILITNHAQSLLLTIHPFGGMSLSHSA